LAKANYFPFLQPSLKSDGNEIAYRRLIADCINRTNHVDIILELIAVGFNRRAKRE
jgi:hypothetical protein